MGVFFSRSSRSQPPIHDDVAFNRLAEVFSKLHNIRTDEAKEKILENIRE